MPEERLAGNQTLNRPLFVTAMAGLQKAIGQLGVDSDRSPGHALWPL